MCGGGIDLSLSLSLSLVYIVYIYSLYIYIYIHIYIYRSAYHSTSPTPISSNFGKNIVSVFPKAYLSTSYTIPRLSCLSGVTGVERRDICCSNKQPTHPTCSELEFDVIYRQKEKRNIYIDILFYRIHYHYHQHH